MIGKKLVTKYLQARPCGEQPFWYNAGNTYNALNELGKGLHALQDIDAHADKFVGTVQTPFGDRLSHSQVGNILPNNVPSIGREADNVNYERERYDTTLKETRNYLQEFNDRTIGLKNK